MISGAIANGSIKIALDGFAKAQQQMNSLRLSGELTISSVDKAGKAASDSCKEAATSAAKADTAFKSLGKSVLALSGIFAASTVAIRSFAGAADPRGALELELAFTRLQIAIGRFFIPILRDAAKWINQVAVYLNGMSNETREAVLHWTKLGLAVGGGAAGLAAVGGIGGQVVGGLAPLVSVLTSVGAAFWRVLGFLGPWGRIIVVIGSVAAALFTLNSASKDVAGTMGKLSQVALSLWNTIKAVWAQLVAVVGPVVSQVEDLLEGLGETIVGGLGKAFSELAPLFTKGVGGIVPLLSAALSGVVPVVSAIVSTLTTLFNSLLPVGIAVAKFYATYWGRMFGTIGKFVSALEPTINKLVNAFAKLFSNSEGADKFQAIFGSIAGFVDHLTASVSAMFDKLDKDAEAFANAINELFSDSSLASFAEDLKPVLTLFSQIEAVAVSAFKGIGDALSPVVDKIRSLFSGGNDKPFAGLAEGLQPVLNLLNSIGQAANKAFAGIKEIWAATVAAIGTQLDKLQPQFAKIGEVVRTVFTFASEQGQRLSDALSGIASRVGPPLLVLFERVGAAISLIVNLAAALVRAIGTELYAAFTKFAGFVGPAFDWIGNKVQWLIDKLTDGFNAVWGPIKAGVIQIVNWFQYLAFKIEEFLIGAINKAINTLNGFIDKLQKALDIANKLNPGEDIKVGRVENVGQTSVEQFNKEKNDLNKALHDTMKAEQPAKINPAAVNGLNAIKPDEKKPEEKKPNDFQGQALGGARFIGIAEAMRAAQQSTVPTKESVTLQAIYDTNQKQLQVQEAIRDKPQPNLGLPR